MKKLWRVELDYGRMGTISSMFFATQMELNSLTGHTIWLHDVLGKHSELSVDFDEVEFELVDLSQPTLDELHKVCGDLVAGWFYPFDYTDQFEDAE